MRSEQLRGIRRHSPLRGTRHVLLKQPSPAQPRTSPEAGALGVVTTKHRPPTHYVDDRLFAGAGIVDAAAELEWRGFRFVGLGHRPAPGTDGYHEYFCADLQCTVKRYGPVVWIGHMGPGPSTNGVTFPDLCLAMLQALLKQYAYAQRILERVDAERVARKQGAK